MGCGVRAALQESMRAAGFDPDQPRDDKGMWSSGGGGGGPMGRGSLPRPVQEAVNYQEAAKDENSTEAKLNGLAQITDRDALTQVATGKADYNEVARLEMASRGLDREGEWVGFDKAKQIWPVSAKTRGEVAGNEENTTTWKLLGPLQTGKTKDVLALAKGKISGRQVARYELANRGMDRNGKWVGFDRAFAQWGFTPPKKAARLLPKAPKSSVTPVGGPLPLGPLGISPAKRRAEEGDRMSVMAWVKSVLRDAAKSGDELGAREIEDRLRKALQAKEGRMCYILDFYPEEGTVVYDVDYSSPGDVLPPAGGLRPLRQRSFTVADDGTVSVGDTATEVEFVGRYEPLEEGSGTGEAAPCGCHGNKQPDKEIHMRDAVKALLAKLGASFTEENAKFLEGATDEQITALETAVTPKEVVKEVEKIVEKQVEVPVQPKTLAEAIGVLKAAKADEAAVASYDAFVAAEAARKTATIKALKDTGKCQFTDEQLAGKDQTELDQLVALSGAKTVSFAGQAPRAAQTDNAAAPAPIDLVAQFQQKKH
jgi:hypothetical protein